MSNCPICNRTIHDEEPFSIMFSEKRNTDVYCCEACEKQYNAIMFSAKPAELKSAINYFYARLKSVKDEELREFLQEMIDDNAASVEEMESEQKHRTQQKQQSGDYFQHRSAAKAQAEEAQSFGWITFLQAISWIAFIALVILGFVLASPLFRYQAGLAWATIIGCTVGGLILLAICMVFLGMAEDIRHIRRKLDK